MKKRLAPVLAAAMLTLGACGPVTFALPGTSAGFSLGDPGSTLRFGPANCLLTGGAYGPRFGMNAAAIAGERMRIANQYAARFSLASSDIRAQQARWSAIAEGGC